MTRDAGGLETRRRFLRMVRDYPGLHLREIARQMDTSVALVEYNLPFLVDAGAVRTEQDERYLRVYPVGEGAPTRAERALLGPLRSEIALHIVLFLLDRGPTRHKDICEALDLGKSKLSFYLRKLEDAGLVRQAKDGFTVEKPARVKRLLLERRPTPDLRERFAELWLGFYGDD